MSVKGIDIASHQSPSFPFARARAEGYEFAIIKASGGHTYRNPYLGAQVAGARAAGMLVGFYHYLFEPTNGGGNIATEARNFIDTVRPYVQPGSTFWLDVEEFPRTVGFDGDLGGAIDQWCETVAAAFGCNVGIYCATWYITPTGLTNDLRLTKRPYWIASWQDAPPTGRFLLPWKEITIWQYDAYGMVGGAQPIDEDRFMLGTVADLAALGVPASAPPETLDPWAYLKVPFGPDGFTVDPLFHGDYSLAKYGYPLGPSAAYGIEQPDGTYVNSGRIFQLFENGVWSTSGRDEPKQEAAGQVVKYMTGKTQAEWPTWKPLS